MDSNPDLPSLPHSKQQQPPIPMLDNPWRKFSTLLIIFNLFCLYLFKNSALLPLAIIDLIAIIAYNKKQLPPWILLLIPLLVFNIYFFYYGIRGINLTAGGVIAIAFIPLSLILLVIDFFTILFTILNNRR
jgi:hypothetical protein